jgi:hypothetical protein
MEIGFEELDELSFVLAKGNQLSMRPAHLRAKNLGTLIELEWLRGAGLHLPTLDDFVPTRRLQLFQTTLAGNRTASFTGEEACSWLIRSYWDESDDPDDWFDFCQALQQAAIATTRLPRKNAQELVAATRELVANIFVHSNSSFTGIAGFAAAKNTLEIVVADKGIGVLDSLKTSTEFKSLRDSGEALQEALTDGSSRFGRTSGHGGGFRALFRGLVNISSSLRFRSGDHALSIIGTNPGLASGRISQKIQLPGFIVHISCTTS